MKQSIIFIFAFFMFFGIARGQQKIGHINSDEVMQAMPEYKLLQARLVSIKASYQNILDAMYAD